MRFHELHNASTTLHLARAASYPPRGCQLRAIDAHCRWNRARTATGPGGNGGGWVDDIGARKERCMRRELGSCVVLGAIGYVVQAATRTRPATTTPRGGLPAGEIDVVAASKAG